MTDPAEIRAEGRRLREALWWTEPDSEEGRTATALWSEWLEEHADVLLADPAPVGLTEKELRLVSDARELAPPNPDYPIPWDRYLLARLVAIIDRLSAAPVDDRERVDKWRTVPDGANAAARRSKTARAAPVKGR